MQPIFLTSLTTMIGFLSLNFAEVTSLNDLGNIASQQAQKLKLPVIQTNAFGMFYGAVFMLVFALVRGTSLQFDASPGYIISLLYLAVRTLLGT